MSGDADRNYSKDVSCCLLQRNEKLIPILGVCIGIVVVLRTNLLKLKIIKVLVSFPLYLHFLYSQTNETVVIRLSKFKLKNLETLKHKNP